MSEYFSERELFLMKEAHSAGPYYASLGDWLDEVISDGGHTVAQHIAHDAERLHGQPGSSEAAVWLGNGDKLVADIHAEDGSWAGVGVFNPPNGKTGGIGEPDGQIDGAPLDDNPPILSIRSHKPESLQVVVDELKESIARMGCTQPQSALVAPIPEISCHETVHGPGEVKRLDDWLEYFDKYSDYHESLALQATIKYLRSLNSTPKPQSAVPAGWKPVPIEPTGRMLKHGTMARTLGEGGSDKVYKAMIEAAPQPPQRSKGDE